MEILPATTEHVHEIARLAGIVWRAHYPGIISPEQIEYMLAKMYDLEQLRREMATGVTYLRAIEAEELLGFAAFGPIANEVKLHKLYVHPQHQRRGIGTELIRHVERASAGRTLVLTVNKRNQHAIAAYKKHGFVIHDSIVVEIGSGFVMDDYVMVKGTLSTE
jgi:diamine N-acetyltransferase